MAPHAVTLRIAAPVVFDCKFWADNDGWVGRADELGITVRGYSFEDAKREMEAALAEHIRLVLNQKEGAGRKSVA